MILGAVSRALEKDVIAAPRAFTVIINTVPPNLFPKNIDPGALSKWPLPLTQTVPLVCLMRG